VRAAQVVITRDGLKLERIGQVALPAGAVRDGEVVDKAAVAAALTELWRRSKFATKKVILGVGNQKVVVRQVEVPAMPLNELRAALPFQVADLIPMPIEQAVLDFHPLEEVVGEDGQRIQRILLVAAVREMVSDMLAAVEEAGLIPEKVDLTPFALLRAAGTPDGLGIQTSAEALVEVGAGVTNIVVHQGGVPRFVRILLQGGSDITSSIADRMGVPIDQAEHVKHTTPLPPDAQSSGVSPAARLLEAAASAWIEEVRGSLDYYLVQPSSVRISKIVLSGGTSTLAGLAQRLSIATRLPVEPVDLFSRIQIGKTGLTDHQLSYLAPLSCVPVGLALGAAA
jgi:type IV pilus assembly protein PilM